MRYWWSNWAIQNTGTRTIILFKGVKQLHTDVGREYRITDLPNHAKTTPEPLQCNPFAERCDRTIFQPVRVMLEQPGFSRRYWLFAAEHVAYVNNRIPQSGFECSPYEKWTGRKPSLKHLRVFACAALIYNPAPKSKEHGRAFTVLLLGFTDHDLYPVQRIADEKIVNTVHVRFDESVFRLWRVRFQLQLRWLLWMDSKHIWLGNQIDQWWGS